MRVVARGQPRLRTSPCGSARDRDRQLARPRSAFMCSIELVDLNGCRSRCSAVQPSVRTSVSPHRSAPHVEYVLEYVLERKRVDDLAGRQASAPPPAYSALGQNGVVQL